MGRFSELDIEGKELDFEADEDFEPWSRFPTNEALPDPTSEEVMLQMQAIVLDITQAEKELTQLLYRQKYYNEPPPREDLQRILSYIEAARRTLA